MTPAQEAIAAVRERMHDVRLWLGETTEEAESYPARHGHDSIRIHSTPGGLVVARWDNPKETTR